MSEVTVGMAITSLTRKGRAFLKDKQSVMIEGIIVVGIYVLIGALALSALQFVCDLFGLPFRIFPDGNSFNGYD